MLNLKNINYRFIYGGGMFFVILLIVIYVFEIKWLQQLIYLESLVKWSLFIGLLFGLGLSYLFRKSGKDLTEKVQIYIFFLVLSLVFAPLAASLSNRMFLRSSKLEQIEIYDIKGRISKSYGMLKGEKRNPNFLLVFYIRNGELFKMRTRNTKFSNHQKGDIIDLKFNKGLWGFEYLDLD